MNGHAITIEEIEQRIIYHPPNEMAVAKHTAIRKTIGDATIHFANELPEGREASLAITKLEEAMFWANAAIARNHDKL